MPGQLLATGPTSRSRHQQTSSREPHEGIANWGSASSGSSSHCPAVARLGESKNSHAPQRSDRRSSAIRTTFAAASIIYLDMTPPSDTTPLEAFLEQGWQAWNT